MDIFTVAYSDTEGASTGSALFCLFRMRPPSPALTKNIPMSPLLTPYSSKISVKTTDYINSKQKNKAVSHLCRRIRSCLDCQYTLTLSQLMFGKPIVTQLSDIHFSLPFRLYHSIHTHQKFMVN